MQFKITFDTQLKTALILIGDRDHLICQLATVFVFDLAPKVVLIIKRMKSQLQQSNYKPDTKNIECGLLYIVPKYHNFRIELCILKRRQ